MSFLGSDKTAPYSVQAVANGADLRIIAQFRVLKVGMFWSTKKRIFQLTNVGFVTIDPSSFRVTNTLDYSDISALASDESTEDQFTLTAKGEAFTFKTAYRTQLLCQLIECATSFCPQLSNLFINFGPFNSQRVRKSKVKVDCRLVIAPYGIVETDGAGKVVQQYLYVNISGYGMDEKSKVYFFMHSERAKIFSCENPGHLLDVTRKQLKLLGNSSPTIFTVRSVDEIFNKRAEQYSKVGSAIAVFDVNKMTRRSSRPVPRQLHISEAFLVEKDASGFQVLSMHKLKHIYAVVRDWENPRQFSLEYSDGTSRTYTTGTRDTMLALVLDICHASGNTRVLVTGEVSDRLRLMPRFADEVYEASLKDAFFGTDSIEVWFMKKVASYCKPAGPIDFGALVQSCRELITNVPSSGVSMDTDLIQIKVCVVGVLLALNHLVAGAYKNPRAANVRGIVVFLQTLCRFIPCAHGYEAFVQVEEVDTRVLLWNLIRYKDDFINYWTLNVLSALCICPFNPRNIKQEFVNKHTLLTDMMLTNLVELMSTRIDSDDDVAPAGPIAEQSASTAVGKLDERIGASDSSSQEVEMFFPNSLVIVSASALLESVLSSRRDTSDPELMNKVLDLLGSRVEILVHMLRSTSFLIMENAAILMHLLIKNRRKAGESLRDAALSDCLVLKHFYNGVFSPSSSQRFISRFLVASWTSGVEENNGKKLLRRIIPNGLMEFLKVPSQTEEQKLTLDEMDEEFYASKGSLLDNSRSLISPGDQKKRMRERVLAVTRDALINKSKIAADEDKSIVTVQESENFRILFHAITQDHQLPDLIWNEQTRLELRSSLEAELAGFESEQRLRGVGKVAWNYQQFAVRYESLQDELKVGPIYVRHFLEADDAFIKSFQGTQHIVLFEKLLRRMLLNVERNPMLSILCARCLTRLYRVSKSVVGNFDDMMIIVRILEQVTNMELQHCMIDFLEELTMDPSNLTQLLDREFVASIIRFASLAHLNPDQIGNMLARATSNPLMLTDSTLGSSSGACASSNISPSVDLTEEQTMNRRKRELWVPHDNGCPQLWFVASPQSSLPPPVLSQMGPYRVSDILRLLDESVISPKYLAAPYLTDDYDDSSKYEAVVDTGLWKPIVEYFQLKTQVLFSGKAVYSPAEISAKALAILNRVAAVHRSVNAVGRPFHPIPESKRIMSDPDHLSIFAQLLLSNDKNVVEIAADLLRSLIQFNLQANSKLYLTGAFFFACRYTGNNFGTIARLFHVSHLNQSFLDSSSIGQNNIPISQRSILGNILPPAMLNILENYPERFASTFTGESETPEVIWNAELRRQVVDMINQHLGDFELRLKQYTLGKYEYCPIPKIHLSLDKEIYCHEYYLKNLCDETRWPNWPIGDPLALLREAIEMWRGEMSKSVIDADTRSAKQVLGLKDSYTDVELRKAYKNLARKYHPDKNPNGRDIFEKIQQSYELLCSIDMNVCETDTKNVILLIKTQNIIYRRFAKDVGDQKYPAFPLLAAVLNVPDNVDAGASHILELLVEGVKLMYYTCAVSNLNGFEFVKSGCTQKLYDIIKFAMSLRKNMNSSQVADFSQNILIYGMKAYSVVASLETGREAIHGLGTNFTLDLMKILSMTKDIPLASENCIELVSQCASLLQLQNLFVGVGVVWKLIPMMLAFDETLGTEVSDESQRVTFNQHSLNQHAILAAKALGRLGGYMFDDLLTPRNDKIRDSMNLLLTAPLAKLLRNQNPAELLRALNDNVEKATKIWNLSMREELLDFVKAVDMKRKEGFDENDLEASKTFAFSATRNELCVDSVYVRIFNKTGDVVDIDDPASFCRSLLSFLSKVVLKGSQLSSIEVEQLNQTIEAIRILAEFQAYIPLEIAKSQEGVSAIFGLLSHSCDTIAFSETAQLFGKLGSCSDFVLYVITNYKNFLWKLLKTFCCGEGRAMPHICAAVEGFCTSSEGLEAFLSTGLIFRLLGSIMGLTGYKNTFQNRTAAATLLSKCLWNPVKGSDASDILRRFLPEPLVVQLKKKSGPSILKVFDEVVENPEIVWTAEMQGELRRALIGLVVEKTGYDTFQLAPVLTPEFVVKYRQLDDELYLGNVYLRLFLKQASFRLSNTIYFLEKLVEYWESAIESQIKPGNAGSEKGYSDDKDGKFQLIVGQENFLSLVTSCIVCIVKSEPTVVDHLLSWGFSHRLCSFLSKALDGGRRGAPVTSVVRILHPLVVRPEILDDLSGSQHILMTQIMRTFDLNFGNTNLPTDPVSLPVESSLLAELLKKIFRNNSCQTLPFFVESALAVHLPEFLLKQVLGASQESLAPLRNSSALKIHTVDALKAMMEADETSSVKMRAILDGHPAWQEYQGQSHDLFLTNKEQVDVFLIEDSSEKRFVGLLGYDSNASLNDSRSLQASVPTPPEVIDVGATVFVTAENSARRASDAASTAPLESPKATSIGKQSIRSPVSAPPSASRSSLNPFSDDSLNSSSSLPQPSKITKLVATESNQNQKISNLAHPSRDSISSPPSKDMSSTAGGGQRSTRPPTSASLAASPRDSSESTKKKFKTTLTRGDYGLGLDLMKTSDGSTEVKKIKEMPPGIDNPAEVCYPPIKEGDFIVGVNSKPMSAFVEVVKEIRASTNTIELMIERRATAAPPSSGK